VVAVLFNEGLQEPLIPLSEIVGNGLMNPPEQIDATELKVGVRLGVIVTLRVCVVAQSPAVGVKTYVPLAVLLITEGLQVPVTPFGDVVPSTGMVAPEQNGPNAGKSGVTLGVMVTLNV